MSREVEVGRIVRPHGLRGEVAVALLTDRPERFAPGRQLSGAGRRFTVISVREHQGRLLVEFEGVADRSTAERLRGILLVAEVADEESSDTYLVSELVGMAVVDDTGEPLGSVTAAVELPAAADYDLLEVTRADGSTWLLPAVEAFVAVQLTADGGERLVVTDPPEGLVDAGAVAPDQD